MPAERQEECVVAVVRERFRHATLETLADKLRITLEGAPETESVYVWGTPGTGKTWALAALARRRIEQGYRVIRETWERLCLRIRDTYKPNARESEWTIIEPLCECDLLLLEDIGTTTSVGRQETDFGLRTLLVIIDSRYEDCLPTLISGNKPVEEIAKSFDARIASRLKQGLIINKTGKDKRDVQPR